MVDSSNRNVNICSQHTKFTETLARPFAVALQRVAPLSANGDITHISCPPSETLHISIVGAYIMAVLILTDRYLACL
jgi:hypothetical protein